MLLLVDYTGVYALVGVIIGWALSLIVVIVSDMKSR